MRFIALSILMCAASPAFAAKPVLNVYTYSSFTADWGPGPAIKKSFESVCNCEINYVGLEDGVSLLSRVRLEGESSKADVVLGLDMNLIADANATNLFAPHNADLSNLTLPLEWKDSSFVPFDFGYFAFVYNSETLSNPPASLDDLINGDESVKILIQDPRTSTPGLGLLLWVQEVYGDRAPEAWAKLSKRVLTVSKGWSEAYGLFLEGEAPLVLSYTTSPAYHIIAEEDKRFAAAEFSEGHYIQIEVAGRLASSSEPELAQQFLEFITTPGFQDQIPTGNWMYPAAKTTGALPEAFSTLVNPAKT